MSALDAVRVRAPAKANLFLEVLARRADGFHEIESVLVALDLEDALEVIRVERRGAQPIGLVLRGGARRDVPEDARNLAWRAAELVHRRALELGRVASDDGLALSLEKHVPSGAGLGGGSSDAAAALLGAALVLGLDPDDPPLQAGLARLGSDCAFFLAARRTGLALCHGRGERVTELAAPRGARCIALLAPECPVSTAGVYAALRVPERPVHFEGDATAWWTEPLEAARARLFNRLEAPALALHPELARWRRLLDELGEGHFRLTGSGSAFIALYDDRQRAAAVLDELAVAAKARDLGLHGRWVVRPTGCGVVPSGRN